MAPRTLKDIAQRALRRNIDGVIDVGDLSYDLVAPALRKIADPQQLRSIELASPHIAEADAELWIALIKRDISDWKTKMIEPSNPTSWWKVYRKLFKEEKALHEAQEEQLSQAMKAKAQEKEANKTNILHAVVRQRFKEKCFFDGVPNVKAGQLGHEGVPSLKRAHQTGKNILSALAKQSSEHAALRRLGTSWDSRPAVETRMWQQPVSVPRITPNRRMGQTMTERTTASALKKAFAEDERVKAERAAQMLQSPSMSPPVAKAAPVRNVQSSASSTEASPARQANKPRPTPQYPTPRNTASPAGPSSTTAVRPTQAARPTQTTRPAQATRPTEATRPSQAARPVQATRQPPAPTCATRPAQPVPPTTASRAIADKPTAFAAAGAGTKRPASPAVTNPMPQKRAKPATSIFMPSKKAKR